MRTLRNLMETANDVQTEVNGVWVPCRGVPWGGLEGLRRRVKDAWAVFTGRADAFTWPGGQ